jgi:hypothetical protein
MLPGPSGTPVKKKTSAAPAVLHTPPEQASTAVPKKASCSLLAVGKKTSAAPAVLHTLPERASTAVPKKAQVYSIAVPEGSYARRRPAPQGISSGPTHTTTRCPKNGPRGQING